MLYVSSGEKAAHPLNGLISVYGRKAAPHTALKAVHGSSPQ